MYHTGSPFILPPGLLLGEVKIPVVSTAKKGQNDGSPILAMKVGMVDCEINTVAEQKYRILGRQDYIWATKLSFSGTTFP